MNVESNSGDMENMQKKQTILFMAGGTQKANKYIIVSKVEIFKQRENKKKMKMWEFSYQSRWAVWWDRVR